jgi:hypothetical protein
VIGKVGFGDQQLIVPEQAQDDPHGVHDRLDSRVDGDDPDVFAGMVASANLTDRVDAIAGHISLIWRVCAKIR